MAVTPTNGYCDGTQLKAALGIDDTTDDAALTRAIDTASRAIDDVCGRFFYDSGSATAKSFRAVDPYQLEVPDFSTTTGLVVKSDTTGDGTFDTTWSSSGSPADYQAEPVERQPGRPYTRIVAIDDKTFPVHARKYTVQVTAQWGWSAVPDPVVEACILLASQVFKRTREAPFGIVEVGLDGMSARLSSRLDGSVATLLAPFRRVH